MTFLPILPAIQQEEGLMIDVACRRCTLSRGRYRSLMAAFREGWRKMHPFDWQTSSANHRGICVACQTHPEEEQ